MDYSYAGYGTGAAYPNYYHGGLNVGFPTYPSMPYLYAPGMVRDRCLPDKQPESKPRLSKDEVEILEAHFRQNPKPPSSVKRELAERMRVELPRINNWFQNRRAKAKQERNQEEYKARQEAAAKASQSPAQDPTASVQEHFPLSNEQAPLQPCVASFESNPLEDQSLAHGQTRPDTARETPESMTPSISTQESSTFSPDNAVSSGEDDMSTHMNDDYSAPQTSCGEYSNVIDNSISSDDGPDMLMYDGLQVCADPTGDVFRTSLSLESPQINFPARDDLSTSEHGSDYTASEPSSTETTAPSIISPPAPTEFKSPPPAADLARRRNRRPLGLSPFPSYHGQPSLKTCAGDMPRRSDTTSPIRRIASATGCAPPRVMKSTTGPAPRSPMFSEQKREALLQSLQQGSGSPVLGLSVNASVAVGPPTPRTPLCIGQRGIGEQGASVASDDDGRYSYQPAQVASFVKIDDPSMKTPPGTPGMMGFPDSVYAPNAIEAAYNYVTPQEEPLFTPGIQRGFPPELDFNPSLAAPEYVASSTPSQPVTPSFPPAAMGPSSFSGGINGSEYSWPDAAINGYASSGRSSPGSKSKTFQFTPNMTPQHFTIEK